MIEELLERSEKLTYRAQRAQSIGAAESYLRELQQLLLEELPER